MKTIRFQITPRLFALFIGCACASSVMAQAPAQPAAPAAVRARAPQGPQVISPEVSADRKITFRFLAPKATSVKVMGGDIPGNAPGATMVKGTNDVWEVTVGPIVPGAYRYNFNVDGLTVIDPRSPAVSESNNNVWSLVTVPGSDWMDVNDVPHGAVASVTYNSKALGKVRRMHVYTPPGYESGRGKYPVFYLLHGASDSDDSWTSVGRAAVIMDNLIAAKKVKPMIVVMPAGHTRQSGPGSPGAPRAASDEFSKDFLGDVMPTVEKNYRVIADRQHRAIAGLSMGGSQTLNIGIPNMEKFGYVGVFSSGLIGSFNRGGRGGAPATPPATPAGPTWEEQHKAELDNAKAKKGLKLVWFATGKDDFLLETSRGTVEMLKKHGFEVTYKETEGGHTWLNWRDYLNEFSQQLFR